MVRIIRRSYRGGGVRTRAGARRRARGRWSSARAPTDTRPGSARRPRPAAPRLPHDRAGELGRRRDRLGVGRAIGLGDDDRLAAELDRERLRDRQHRAGGGHRGVGAGELAQVHRGAGEGDRRVHGQRDRARARRRARARPMPYAGSVCSTSWPGCQAPTSARPATRPGELVVRHRDHDQFAAPDDLERRRARARPAASPRRARRRSRA